MMYVLFFRTICVLYLIKVMLYLSRKYVVFKQKLHNKIKYNHNKINNTTIKK